MWQLMDMSFTGSAKIAIYSVTFSARYDFFVVTLPVRVLNVLGGVLPQVIFAVLEL